MVKHPGRLVCLAVVVIVAWSGGASAANLDGRVAYSLKKIGPALDKAENVLKQGDVRNAKVYLESAQREWEMIHKDFKGAFDEDHPDIVAARTRLAAVKKKIEAAAGSSEAKPTPTPAATTARLNPNLAYAMRQILPNLDRAEKAVADKELRQANTYIEEIEKTWNTQKKWEAGKFDPKHPEIVAFETRVAKVRAAVSGLDAQAADAAENLPAVLNAIAENSKRLDEAYNTARVSFRALSSLRSSIDSGREQDLGKLRAKMDELAILVEGVNVLLPDANAAAKAFRKQYPDFNALEKLVPNGRKAGQAVVRLEEFPSEWLKEITRELDGALDEAESNITMYGLNQREVLEGTDEQRKVSAANSADKWVVQYADLLLDWIPMGLPELPKASQALLPEFVKARKEALARAAPMRKNIAMIGGLVGEARKEVFDAKRRKLEQARFPKSKYSGAEQASAEKVIRQAWAKKITDKKLLKVAIYQPWNERSEARWRNDHWIVGTYRYIGANCLAKLPSGKHMVYRMTFRNTRGADGKWSELEQWSVGHVYEILAENIDK
jgi:hypothetical protein